MGAELIRRRRPGRIGGHDISGQEVAAGRPSARTITWASCTAGWLRSAAVISPSSMRKPRILTCPSVRPRKSISPSAQAAHAVAADVEAAARLGGERVGEEPLRGQVRAAQVSPDDARSTQQKRAGGTDRTWLHRGVQDVASGAGDRPADRRGPSRLARGCDHAGGRGGGVLGRAVLVEEPDGISGRGRLAGGRRR